VIRKARPIRQSDLPQCIALAQEPILKIAGSEDRAVRSFASLIKRNSLIGAVIPGSSNKEVLGFATAIAISDDLLRSVLKPDSPGFLTHLFDVSGSSDEFLTEPQIERIHQGHDLRSDSSNRIQGVNLMSCFAGWSPDYPAVKDGLAKALRTFVTGLRVGSYHKELYDKALFDEFSRFFGLPLKLATGTRYVAGLSREEWEHVSNPVQPVNDVFWFVEPSINLTRRERLIVQAYIDSPASTQSLIAERLDIRHMKDHIASIIYKVSGHVTFEDTRGKQKWHEVIDYFIENPQEYRPWVTMKEQCDLEL